MKKKIIILYALLLGIAFGCNEDVLEKTNPNGVTVDDYYKNGAELSSAVTAVYSMLKSNNLVAREWFFHHDLRSDDVAAGGGQLETPRNQLLLGTYDTGNGVLGTVWLAYYRLIHRANAVADNSEKVSDISDENKKRLLAEARFLRAFAYYELVSMWGDVPLYTNYVTSVDGSLPRTSADEVYAYVITELQAIQADLPLNYDAGNQGRATKGAAQMLLARVHLQKGDYANAKVELLKVYNSGQYALVDNYNDNFLEETEFNKESIFEVNFFPSGGVYNWDGDGNGATAGTETVRTQEYSAIGWRKFAKLKTEPLTYFQANKHELLPIPQQEVDNNPKIEPGDQNPGY